MTYWDREHQANLRIIGDLIRELDTMRDETIPNLIRDLADDDTERTEDARAAFAEARANLGKAIGGFERARSLLPEPRLVQVAMTASYPATCQDVSRYRRAEPTTTARRAAETEWSE